MLRCMQYNCQIVTKYFILLNQKENKLRTLVSYLSGYLNLNVKEQCFIVIDYVWNC